MIFHLWHGEDYLITFLLYQFNRDTHTHTNTPLRSRPATVAHFKETTASLTDTYSLVTRTQGHCKPVNYNTDLHVCHISGHFDKTWADILKLLMPEFRKSSFKLCICANWRLLNEKQKDCPVKIPK